MKHRVRAGRTSRTIRRQSSNEFDVFRSNRVEHRVRDEQGQEDETVTERKVILKRVRLGHQILLYVVLDSRIAIVEQGDHEIANHRQDGEQVRRQFEPQSYGAQFIVGRIQSKKNAGTTHGGANVKGDR